MVFIENAVLSVETDDILPALNLQVGKDADQLAREVRPVNRRTCLIRFQ